ncbi:DUF6480 family protein [Mycolicibacterium smegmatis]|uniref:DUF6480 family protein n=1 Tax=Mycolicibacterium smegmatis TaxID=1772 RepID=UPI0005D883B4|nr:DUF6480 family protein [Mycolicibacterium smegmatis]MDF1897346.1 DUF6480 family protein [Mycolicibacterium smegmatis]MDF1904211.1 DUF6480 family protein [Mycolicibacterium smegmatis]MDF1916912.1 DUF6480 family protein [Mycolicibacterium smegmatis]MDF1922286.1 DUF6480 family protein [Mycolicibacterium smegmatis]UAK56192.1 DUF6480 family protein [Mycolicibacterium smegmatis]
MTAVPPDPNPADTPDLEPGGGVAPCATPPDSAQTSGLGEPAPRPKHKITPTAAVSGIGLVLFLALFIAAGVLLILNMTGVFD